ncbi:MAG: peptidoglycan DD-metalloendopeptidase family protein, partial [Pseudomonadales bacterium]|nr:peptidoglycan DD-metalloendopeptidase family protein [Gammaproteobacteria bacterium]NNL57433.1 peptidoglycan DD-metalloendopeptidase family protein [Pseudomonadales bacterium]
SLSRAAEKAGLSAATTMNMANIFGGVMDFALDVRSGDRFTVIYEEHYLQGKKIKDGVIVAAQYVNNGTSFNAFRYEHSNGEVGYYNEEGVSMRKAFLRAPLDFTRVSSSFNMKRLHPITKKVKPHRGIDYAARRGTPVYTVGDGRVVKSGYSKANGKYVVIKHGESYTTKYLHLDRRSVKRGQRVKQGQVIGNVGCTGLCTGPHLHYEFLAHGVHRNPRTIIKKLPKAKKLAKSERHAFANATDRTREILQHFSQQFELASLSTDI